MRIQNDLNFDTDPTSLRVGASAKGSRGFQRETFDTNPGAESVQEGVAMDWIALCRPGVEDAAQGKLRQPHRHHMLQH